MDWWFNELASEPTELLFFQYVVDRDRRENVRQSAYAIVQLSFPTASRVRPQTMAQHESKELRKSATWRRHWQQLPFSYEVEITLWILPASGLCYRSGRGSRLLTRIYRRRRLRLHGGCWERCLVDRCGRGSVLLCAGRGYRVLRCWPPPPPVARRLTPLYTACSPECSGWCCSSCRYLIRANARARTHFYPVRIYCSTAGSARVYGFKVIRSDSWTLKVSRTIRNRPVRIVRWHRGATRQISSIVADYQPSAIDSTYLHALNKFERNATARATSELQVQSAAFGDEVRACSLLWRTETEGKWTVIAVPLREVSWKISLSVVKKFECLWLSAWLLEEKLYVYAI